MLKSRKLIMHPSRFPAKGGGFVVPPFDPSTLPLTIWTRGSYSGAPWVGTASSGASGGRNLIVGSAPTTGTAVSGFTPASFGGTKYLYTGTVTSSQCISVSAYTIHILLKPGDQPADISSPASQNGIIEDANSSFGIHRNVNNVQLQHSGTQRSLVSVPQGSWALYSARLGKVAGELDIFINGSLTDHKTSVPNTGALGSYMLIGTNWLASLYYTGDIMEIMMQDSAQSDLEIAGIYGYMKARYPAAGI